MQKILLVALIVLLGLPAIAQQKDNVAIGFYNLENLFDTENDPLINDEQFLPDGDYQWTEERYQQKLQNMSKVISLVAKEHGGVVALGVSEIENERVLRDLVATDNLKPFNMDVVHYDSPDRRGVDVALLYQKERFQVISACPYRLITSDTNFRTRDQLLVTGILDNCDTLSIIVNHWPSKLGGEKRSMPKRIAAAQLSKHISDSLMNANPQAKVIIMGDLNDNPNAKSIQEYLGAKSRVKDVKINQLYNPMYKLYMEGIWSYVYRDEPNVIDQVVISYGLLHAQRGFQYHSAHIYRANFLLNKSGSFEGTPMRTFAAGTYLGGYSDHLPVYILINKVK